MQLFRCEGAHSLLDILLCPLTAQQQNTQNYNFALLMSNLTMFANRLHQYSALR